MSGFRRVDDAQARQRHPLPGGALPDRFGIAEQDDFGNTFTLQKVRGTDDLWVAALGKYDAPRFALGGSDVPVEKRHRR